MSDHRSAMAKAAREAAKGAERRYKEAHPEAQRLSLKADIVAFRRRPKEFRDFHRRAVALFLTEPETTQFSNMKLVERLNQGMGFKAPTNVLTEKLGAAKKRDIGEILQLRGIDLDLTRHDTVSKIKAQLRAYNVSKYAENTAMVKVAFADDSVVINGRRHPIQISGGHRRVHAGNKMLNVDGLKTLLLPEG